MSAYSEYFLSRSRRVVGLQLLEISHPNFSQTYYKVRNARGGVTVTLENSSVQLFDYLPMRITQIKATDDLDTGITVIMRDVGVTLPKEIDNVDVNDGYGVQPTVIYRLYRSDQLGAPLYGPIPLKVRVVTFDRGGLTFEAIAPRLNYNKTGELYTFDRFPMLRGFL